MKRQGQEVNHKRVRRLMRVMGLKAIHSRRRRSFSSPGHKTYPYLLEGAKAERADEV